MQAQLESLLAELDGYIAADCPLCGLAMIRAVSVPLIVVEKDSQEAISWELSPQIN
jgi:hypothetical protein